MQATLIRSKKSASSSRWLQRAKADPFARSSSDNGDIHVSRAAYKLLELDNKYRLIANAKRIIELGAAPGGWCQVISSRKPSHGRFIAVDLLDLDETIQALEGISFIQGDFLDSTVQEQIKVALAGDQADLIVSDMVSPHKKCYSCD